MAASKFKPETIRTLSEILTRSFSELAWGKPINEKDIETTFNIGDPTVYRWTVQLPFISVPGKLLFMLTAPMGSFLLVTLVVIFPLYLVNLKWPRLAFWVSVVLLVLFLLNLLKDHLLFLIGSKRIKLLMETHLIFFAVFPLLIVTFMMWSPAPVMRGAFIGNTGSRTQWMLFFIDHVKNVLLLGIPEALNWKFSSIGPTLWYSRLASQILQLLIALGFIDLVLLSRRLAFSDIEFYGTVRDASFQCHPLKNFHGTLKREARVSNLFPAEIVSVQAFRKAYPFSPAHGWD